LPDRHFSVGLRRAAAAGLRVVVFQAGMAVLRAVAEFTAADLPAEAVDFTVAECLGAARLAEEEVFMAVVVLRVVAVADTAAAAAADTVDRTGNEGRRSLSNVGGGQGNTRCVLHFCSKPRKIIRQASLQAKLVLA
jgi:hypothetical protein